MCRVHQNTQKWSRLKAKVTTTCMEESLFLLLAKTNPTLETTNQWAVIDGYRKDYHTRFLYI